jgi:hypothetical protein
MNVHESVQFMFRGAVSFTGIVETNYQFVVVVFEVYISLGLVGSQR